MKSLQTQPETLTNFPAKLSTVVSCLLPTKKPRLRHFALLLVIDSSLPVDTFRPLSIRLCWKHFTTHRKGRQVTVPKETVAIRSGKTIVLK